MERGATSAPECHGLTAQLMARRLLVDEVLKRAFVDAYLRYEIGFAQFTTSVTTQAGEADQQARYSEFTEAQHAFLQSARQLAQSLSEQ